jgi:hypothetical protein
MGVDLYWIPLGAGGSSVRVNGVAFEAAVALAERRRRRDLYHSALVVTVPDGTYVVEMAPVPDSRGERRGVVAEGAVGTQWAGRLRVFRYEVRRWRDGVIPDIAEAVASPVRVADDTTARRLLALVPLVPAPVWGRDELRAGEMWDSNSVTSWLLATAGVDVATVPFPPNGRAPGWDAGVVVARRILAIPYARGETACAACSPPSPPPPRSPFPRPPTPPSTRASAAASSTSSATAGSARPTAGSGTASSGST